MTDYRIAATASDYGAAAILFREYAEAINVNLDFQDFDQELVSLEQMYAWPAGGILLAVGEADVCVGCIAIRKHNQHVAELKRMYVKPLHQKKGIGKYLLAAALSLAKEYNYKKVRLDTLSQMQPAIHLYTQAGFYEIPAYYTNPLPSVIYFEKLLH